MVTDGVYCMSEVAGVLRLENFARANPRVKDEQRFRFLPLHIAGRTSEWYYD